MVKYMNSAQYQNNVTIHEQNTKYIYSILFMNTIYIYIYVYIYIYIYICIYIYIYMGVFWFLCLMSCEPLLATERQSNHWRKTAEVQINVTSVIRPKTKKLPAHLADAVEHADFHPQRMFGIWP